MITKCDVFENQNLRLLYPRKWGNLSLWTWYKTYLLNGTQATVGERGSPDPLGSWVLHLEIWGYRRNQNKNKLGKRYNKKRKKKETYYRKIGLNLIEIEGA